MPADAFPLVLVGLAGLAVGALNGVFVSWLILRQSQLNRELAALRAEMERLARPRRAWLDEIQLDARTGLLNAVTLWELSVRDGLEALRQLSPERAQKVVNEVMERR